MSNRKSDGGPAFPVPDNFNHGGMSLRDWFAGLAMQALVSSSREYFYGNVLDDSVDPNRLTAAGPDWDGLAEHGEARVAYALADRMLKAREVRDDDKK